MTHKRVHFVIPEDLLVAIDKVAGKGKRNSLAVEILDHEIRRRRLLQILDDATGCWKDEDHPELKNGSYAWVRQMRDADAKRTREKFGDWLEPKT
jgi:hypothetical protein